MFTENGVALIYFLQLLSFYLGIEITLKRVTCILYVIVPYK